MEYRAGKCSQCGAEYQIPASFAHNVARCKKCKVGVVHVSAAKGMAAEAASAPQPPARPAASVPEAAGSAAPPPERRAPEAASRRGEAVSSTRARTSNERSPEPAGVARREPERPAAQAPEADGDQPARSPKGRGVLLGVGLLLVAAVVCVWFFYFRDSA